MINPQKDVKLSDHCTFRLGGKVRYFLELTDENLIPEIVEFSRSKNVSIMMLGSGSNCIFTDAVIERFALKMGLKGLKKRDEDDQSVTIEIKAGENWDATVAWAVEHGYSGIEALSAIPGTVGAAPVQNIGAYGQEVKDTLLEVLAYDTTEKKFVILCNIECRFSYRASIFNTYELGRYIITSIVLKLSKIPAKIPDYPDVRKYFEGKYVPTILDIRNAIISIRATKLPDPSVMSNVGSFFKNVLVEKEVAKKLSKDYPNMPTFPSDGGKIKIPAGWLIDTAGLKGKNFGNISIYDKNALVLVNNGQASFTELLEAKKFIVNAVKQKYGLTLEQEPLLID